MLMSRLYVLVSGIWWEKYELMESWKEKSRWNLIEPSIFSLVKRFLTMPMSSKNVESKFMKIMEIQIKSEWK